MSYNIVPCSSRRFLVAVAAEAAAWLMTRQAERHQKYGSSAGARQACHSPPPLDLLISRHTPVSYFRLAAFDIGLDPRQAVARENTRQRALTTGITQTDTHTGRAASKQASKQDKTSHPHFSRPQVCHAIKNRLANPLSHAHMHTHTGALSLSLSLSQTHGQRRREARRQGGCRALGKEGVSWTYDQCVLSNSVNARVCTSVSHLNPDLCV